MSKKPSGTEIVAAVAQWQGQQNPSMCPLGSTVKVEPHHADPMLLNPQRLEPLYVIVMGDALKYTTVTGEVVVVIVTGDMMRNILQMKHLSYIFPMTEDRNTCRRVIVNTSRGRGPKHLVHNRYMAI